jgi:hypothetical protein
VVRPGVLLVQEVLVEREKESEPLREGHGQRVWAHRGRSLIEPGAFLGLLGLLGSVRGVEWEALKRVRACLFRLLGAEALATAKDL